MVPARLRLPRQRSLRSKIILPYLVLTLVVAFVSAYVIARVLTVSASQNFQNQLFTRAGAAADRLVQLERQQLAAWRQIAFTAGLDEAVTSGDRAQLQLLVEPIFVNGALARVDLVAADGRSLLRLTGSELPGSTPDYNGWELVQRSLTEPESRFVGLQQDQAAVYLFTAGAILDPGTGHPAGALLVGRPLSDVAAQLETDVLAGISLYTMAGRPLASSLQLAATTTLEGLEMPAELAGQVLAQQAEALQIRRLNTRDGDQVEALLPFELNAGQDVGVLGVSLPGADLTSPLTATRNALVVVSILATLATLTIGYSLAHRIVRPIEALTQAAEQVAQGDLTIRVPAADGPGRRGDEIDRLGTRFNAMVGQLNQRHYMEDLLGRYVGREIAKSLLAGQVNLGGQRVKATVLFSDIRDFTTFTEKNDLSTLMDELNEYYTLMQQVISQHGGVINKFGGDSILAIFGAPIPLPNHAQQAVLSAAAMMDQLAVLNKRRAARGKAPFNIGIGVNSGEMVVGNLGSEQRQEYTVLGDAVNVASRLSDLNKETPFHSIFISARTQQEMVALPGWEVTDMGQVFVKGKIEPVGVYALMPLTALPPLGSIPAGSGKKAATESETATAEAGDSATGKAVRLLALPVAKGS